MTGWIKLALTTLLAGGLVGCGPGGPEIDIQEILSRPKTYVSSEECRFCHLEHYDSWRTTLHSRTIQDVTENLDALITEINPEVIRADLNKLEKELNLPVDEIYIPKVEEIRYTIGNQWKQRFLVEKNGMLYIAV
jgi:hypothetical protein